MSILLIRLALAVAAIRRVRALLAKTFPLVPKPFPPDFLFGVASADHQTEARDETRFGPDIRDSWEARPGMVPRGNATDFWNRFRDDIALARSLGCKTFRISLSWSRIEPADGVFDPQVIEHYGEVLQAIRAADMLTIVSLHHNVWPLHVERRGGMIASEFPMWFARYAEVVASKLGRWIDYYITINEPNQLVYGYVKPWWCRDYPMPPGNDRGATTEEQLEQAERLIPNLFRANALAYDAIHRTIDSADTQARVGSNPLLVGLPGWLQSFLDWNALRQRQRSFALQNRLFAERIFPEVGRVDVIIGHLSATRERASRVGLSEAYLEAHAALLVHRALEISDLSAFDGKLAVVRSTTSSERAGHAFPFAHVVLVDTSDEAVRHLRSGAVDAVLGDDLVLEQYVGSELRLVVDTRRRHADAYVAAVAPGNRELLNAVDDAISDFKLEQWSKHVSDHLPRLTDRKPPTSWKRTTLAYLRRGDQALPTPPASTRMRGTSALERIRKRGRVRIGIVPDAPGLCRAEGKGSYRGIEPALARHIAMNIFADATKVEFVPLGVRERLDAIRSPLRFLDPFLRFAAVFSTMLTTNWWHLGMSGRLPEFLCPSECRAKQDFVGFDYYWGLSSLSLGGVAQLIDASMQHYCKAPVWPGVLRTMIARLSKAFPELPILVIENGCVPSADGLTRSEYLRRHIREVQRSITDGCKVTAYLCWSITSNREWGIPFDANSDFGLFYIDLDDDPTLTRRATAAAFTYRGIIENRTT